MRPTLRLALWFPLALAAPAQAGQSDAPPPVPRFKVVVLETLGHAGGIGNEEACAINASGETAGQVFVAGSAHAARWSANGTLTVLGTTGGCSFSAASAINAAGAVVGTSLLGAPDNAFLWTPAGGMAPLGLPYKCYPEAILGDGTVAFTAIPPGSNSIGVSWVPGVAVNRIEILAGEVLVRDLSSDGAVVGMASYPGSSTRAFRWTDKGGLVDLGVPNGFTHSHANGVNEQGVVVGLSRSDTLDQATRWTTGQGAKLLPFARATSTQASANAINSAGWIVGTEYELAASFRPFAVLWVDGNKAYELTSLLSTAPGAPFVHVSVAWDVNEVGQIAARGVVGGVERALRLDPLL